MKTKESIIKRVSNLTEDERNEVNMRWLISMVYLYDTCMDMDDYFDKYYSDVVIEEEDRKKTVEFLRLAKETMNLLVNCDLLREHDIAKLMILIATDVDLVEIMERCIDTRGFTSQYETIHRLMELFVNGIRKMKPRFVEIIKKQ